MSLILTPSVVSSAGTKSVANVAFDTYQTSKDTINQKIYFDNSTYFLTLGTAVGTGTQTVQTTNRPLVADPYETVYYYTNTEADRPLVGESRDYMRITAPSANDGRKYTFANDLSNQNFCVLVVKSSSSSISGKLKIRSTAGNESVCSFTTSATADTWERKIFNFKVNGSTGVTFTGTPVFSAITEVEITLDTLGTSVDVAMFYCVNQYEQIIGNILKARISCVSEYSIGRTINEADLICRQEIERSTVTEKSYEITFGSKKQDLFIEGMGKGTMITRKTAYLIETVNSVDVGAKIITAGIITLNIGNNLDLIDTVYIGNNRLVSYDSATNVPVNGYHYNTATGVWTFHTSRNGKIPTITVNNAQSLDAIEDKGLLDGYVGLLRIEIIKNDSKIAQYEARKAKLTFSDTAVDENFDQDNTKFKVYRDNNGIYMTKYLQPS